MSAPDARLAALLPRGEERLDSGAILDRFVSWASAAGLELYPAQEEAILELLDGKHVVLATPTGSGKSLVATALHFKAMAEGKVSVYTAPIKALVNEKFFALCEAFSPENVGMLTGDAAINRDAPILCCTAEILANLALREAKPNVASVVMDEFHYYADRDRGVAWQLPLLALEDSAFLLMSATLGDTSNIERALTEVTGREVASIRSGQRPVPLDYEYRETPLHETIEELISKGKAPVYLVNFSQRAAAEQAQNLMSVNFSSKEEKERIREALLGMKFDTPYGKELQRFLRHGIGLHHAGLLPKYRLLVERLSQQGLLKVISGTDTLGVGVNIPIRTVLFTQLCKFTGEKTAILSVRDFQQIAGRAGRKGFDVQGSVVAQAPEHVIENLRLEAKAAGKGKKIVKKQPPAKGYVPWDRKTFEKLISGTPEPLESRFQVTHGMLLNLLQAQRPERGGGYGFLVKLIRRSHGRDWDRTQHLKQARRFLRSLLEAQLVTAVKAEGGGRLEVNPGLQRDFSLNHTLALYLLDALEKLDPTLETYALDIVTLVESILENPDVVLYAQLDRLKGEKIAELKAQRVEYEQRMEELEKLEWPKPNRDFIYGTFNEFARQHPWVGEENIRPKSIVRELLETGRSFHDFIRDYGLQRSEGVVLRYVNEAYKALVQTVPGGYRTDELEDVIAFLRLTLRTVDSSLLDEWESLRNPAYVQPERVAPSLQVGPVDPAADPKKFAARVRSELHRLLVALARKNYDEALAAIRNAGGGWTVESLEQELAPYWAEHAAIDVTPAARRPDQSFIVPEQPRVWSARQKLWDPAGNQDWVIDCVVDLREPVGEDQPLIDLRRIGT